jgi:hypothetical protein
MDTKLYKQMLNSEGYKINRKIQRLDNTLYILIQNYQTLLKLLEYYQKEDDIWNIVNRKKLNTLSLELTRHLHNYLASVASLIDHTRIFKESENDTNLSSSYDSKKVELIMTNEASFLKELRNYTLHFGLPPVILNEKVEKNIETRQFMLSKDDLLEYSGWNSSHKNFINNYEGDLNIISIINLYQESIRKFYDWFYKSIEEKYKSQLKEFDDLAKKHNQLYELFIKSATTIS